MDFIRDLWASLVAGARDRTTNPLSISFVINWCLWNYKFFLILFGDVSTWEKLDAIGLMYPHQPSTYCGAALLYPLLSSLAYVFVYPVVSLVPIRVYRTYQVWTANLIKKVEKARVLSYEEATELTRRHEREKTELEARVGSLSGELQQMRTALRDAEEQASAATANTSNSSIEKREHQTASNEPEHDVASSPTAFTSEFGELTLANPEVELIINLSEQPGLVRAKAVADAMHRNFSLVDADLNTLKSKGLVRSDLLAIGGLGWALTPEGRQVAVDILRAHENAR